MYSSRALQHQQMYFIKNNKCDTFFVIFLESLVTETQNFATWQCFSKDCFKTFLIKKFNNLKQIPCSFKV